MFISGGKADFFTEQKRGEEKVSDEAIVVYEIMWMGGV